MDGVRAKLRRADFHRKSFDALLRSFLEDDPYPISFHFDTETGWHRFVWHVRKEAPKKDFALIFGDMLSNLRGTLDYLAWQLVLVSGNTPTDRTMFPVVKDPGNWASHRGDRLAGVEDHWAGEIEKLQPYHRADHPEWHKLAILDYVNNLNKHRALPIAITSADLFVQRVDVRSMPVGDRLEFETGVDKPIEDDAYAFRFRWVEQRLELPVDMYQPPTIRISFRDGLGYNWTNDDLFAWVERAIRIFEPAFAR
jgi:hypothetical protein